jgi:hypothetical protein
VRSAFVAKAREPGAGVGLENMAYCVSGLWRL